MHRPSASPEHAYADAHGLELVPDNGRTDGRAARLAELTQQAALIAEHVTRLRERPLFARDDISERQADELETRLRDLRQSMAAVRAARGAA